MVSNEITAHKKKAKKFIQDEWTKDFCSAVQKLDEAHKIPAHKYFARKLGIEASGLSHILRGGRNYPVKHRLEAETLLAKINGGEELYLLENAINDKVTFAEVLETNEKLSKEIASLKDKLVDKEQIIKTQGCLSKYCVRVCPNFSMGNA